jgi:predicted amidohydrolase
MTSKDRIAMMDRLRDVSEMLTLGDIEREIDRAVRKARREARSEATTCVDCRVVLLPEVPLCEDCVRERKRFYADAAKRREDRECEEAADMAEIGAQR